MTSNEEEALAKARARSDNSAPPGRRRWLVTWATAFWPA